MLLIPRIIIGIKRNAKYTLHSTTTFRPKLINNPSSIHNSKEVKSLRSGLQAESRGVEGPSFLTQSWVDSMEAQAFVTTNWTGSKQRESLDLGNFCRQILTMGFPEHSQDPEDMSQMKLDPKMNKETPK
nr:hypothetical protein Iba_chr06eCG3020 [Ipomoea batatas]